MGKPFDFPEREPAEERIITSIVGGGAIERPGSTLGTFLQVYGIGDVILPPVNHDTALTVPAVSAAIAFLSRTLAALPLHAYRKTTNGPEKIAGGLETLIHEAPNAEWTAFKLRQYFWQQVFIGGRGLLYIERSGSNITGLYPINPAMVGITRDSLGRTTYQVEGKPYPAADIIDIPFMLRTCGVMHYSPIMLGLPAIQLALAMNQYGSQFFAGGGVPPLVLTGPLPSGPEAMKRARDDIQRSIDLARREGKQFSAIPPGYELKPIGIDAEKSQLVEARRFQVEEIARIYSLPPVFLQDLTNGTFSNTEQQDLFFVKHLVGQWAQALEEEMNLKLFGQRNGGRYVEHNLDGLLRGDFATRMAGLATGIQNAILTPNEARALENRPSLPEGDDLLIQGATVPLGTQPDPGDANESGTPSANDAA
jgi:HK97 family phage portal protein